MWIHSVLWLQCQLTRPTVSRLSSTCTRHCSNDDKSLNSNSLTRFTNWEKFAFRKRCVMICNWMFLLLLLLTLMSIYKLFRHSYSRVLFKQIASCSRKFRWNVFEIMVHFAIETIVITVWMQVPNLHWHKQKRTLGNWHEICHYEET